MRASPEIGRHRLRGRGRRRVARGRLGRRGGQHHVGAGRPAVSRTPVTGQRVYDYAGIFSPAAIAQAEQTILAIEQRTGAQVAVYTQVKPDERHARQGQRRRPGPDEPVGRGPQGLRRRAGHPLRHAGQPPCTARSSLYAGSGFRAAFLTDSDRQAIFDNDMKPLLVDGRLRRRPEGRDWTTSSSAATPEHADQLNRARILNALVGFAVLAISIWLVGVRDHPLVHARPRPDLRRRQLRPDARPAGRPDSGHGDAPHGRSDLEPNRLGGDGGPGGPRPDPVPPGGGDSSSKKTSVGVTGKTSHDRHPGSGPLLGHRRAGRAGRVRRDVFHAQARARGQQAQERSGDALGHRRAG